MALVNRVSRLFKADFHAVLDRIEEPDILLRQSIREMQDDVYADQQQLKRLQAELQHAEQRQSNIQHSLQQVEEELDICFAAGKHDLARQVVRRKLEQQQRLQQLTQQQLGRQQQAAEIEQRLSEHRSQLQLMLEKAECLLDPAATEEGYPETVETGVQERDVEVAFLREQQRRAS